MIVPRQRLIFWVAVIVLPFALVGAVEPGAAVVSALAISGLLLLALFDALGAWNRLAGISVSLPPLARMSRDRPSKLEVRIRNERQQSRDLRLGLPLPREIQCPNEELQLRLPAQSEWSRLDWACCPRTRGSYRLRTAHLETNSPLGFWAVRKQFETGSEIRVYPNLLREGKDLAALLLRRGSVGWHTQRQIGKGREFEKLREYMPGDSYDEIHWKATAKRGRPITKIFQIEHTQEIYAVIDGSRLSARPVTDAKGANKSPDQGTLDAQEPAADLQPPTTLDRYLTAALVLGLAAERQGDLFGVLTFSNQVENFVRAKNGKAHYGACRDALYAFQPKLVTPDYDEVCAFLRLRLRRRALIVFLTELDDPVLAESFVRNMELICRQHLVLVNMLQPPGMAPLFSNPQVDSVEDIYDHLGGHLRWQNMLELQKLLQRRGVGFALLANERFSAALVGQYVGVKRRQAL